jgi:hypothetical protein
LKVNVKAEKFDVAIDGKTVLDNGETLDPVRSLERISFRTGSYRVEPLIRTPKSPGEDMPGADDPVAPATFFIDDLEVLPGKSRE